MRSLTDDVNLAVQQLSDPVEADATLRSLHIAALGKLAAHAKIALDLDLNLAKSALLLPPAMLPLPTASPTWK